MRMTPDKGGVIRSTVVNDKERVRTPERHMVIEEGGIEAERGRKGRSRSRSPPLAAKRERRHEDQ